MPYRPKLVHNQTFLRKFIGFLGIFLVLLSGCDDQNGSVAPRNFRIACVGTSITQGEGLQPTEKTYPQQLQLLVSSQDTVQNYGISGSTVLKKGNNPYWDQSAYRAVLDWNPGIIIIELGTNDTKSINWGYKSDFKADYSALIRSFQALSSKPDIYICKSPPAFKPAYGIDPLILKNDIQPLIDEIARETKVQVIDLYTPLSGKDSLFPDGIHPNEEGTGLLADVIRKFIKTR